MLHHHRRAFLRTSLAAFAGLAAQLPHLGCTARLANANRGRLREDTPLHWDAFLEAVQAEAARQTEKSWEEKEYVARASALARRLWLDDPVIEQAFGKLSNRHPDFPEFAVPHREQLFQISLIQFEPGEVIRHHDHPGMTGVLLCATGRLEVQNFTLAGQAGDGNLVLRQDADESLARGQTGTLTSTDRNIHRVRAPVFSEVVDIFTPPYNDDRIKRSRWFEVDDRPLDGRPGHVLARVKA